MLDCLQILFAKGTQGVCGGVEEVCVSFQQWSEAGSEAHEEDLVRLAASSHAIIGPGEPVMHVSRRELDSAGCISALRTRDLADV